MIIVSKENFKKWLEKEEYKTWTGSGYPSTVYQYINAVEKVMRNEGIETYSELTDHIQNLIHKYDKYGALKNFGDVGHKTVINALYRFIEFLINEYDFQIKTKSWNC